MSKQHAYGSTIVWTGDRGHGTSEYRGYDRTWEVRIPGKPVIRCSNDPLLGGDPSKPNPEDLLLSSLSACHMLWYLHLCAVNAENDFNITCLHVNPSCVLRIRPGPTDPRVVPVRPARPRA